MLRQMSVCKEFTSNLTLTLPSFLTAPTQLTLSVKQIGRMDGGTSVKADIDKKSIIYYHYFFVLLLFSYNPLLPHTDSVMGMTFLALGTSIPEAMSSIILTSHGFGPLSVSNSIQSNIFDICLCLGLPWLFRSLIDPTAISGQPMWMVSLCVHKLGPWCTFF